MIGARARADALAWSTLDSIDRKESKIVSRCHSVSRRHPTPQCNFCILRCHVCNSDHIRIKHLIQMRKHFDNLTCSLSTITSIRRPSPDQLPYSCLLPPCHHTSHSEDLGVPQLYLRFSPWKSKDNAEAPTLTAPPRAMPLPAPVPCG